MKHIIVLGAGGFIGGHLVKRLKSMGHWVRGVDIKPHEFNNLPADEFLQDWFFGEILVFQCAGRKIDTENLAHVAAGKRGGAGRRK